MLLGTLLIAGGAVMIGYFGIVPEPTHSLDDLLALFNRPAFVAYFSVLGLIVVVILIIVRPRITLFYLCTSLIHFPLSDSRRRILVLPSPSHYHHHRTAVSSSSIHKFYGRTHNRTNTFA